LALTDIAKWEIENNPISYLRGIDLTKTLLITDEAITALAQACGSTLEVTK